MLDFQIPRITSESVEENRGSFVIEPLDRGFGYTFGNSLRRVLLSSLAGAAVISALFVITRRNAVHSALALIGTLLALCQWDEFRLHVRAALTEGGFTPDDIKEIVLQQAIYCGVPAANHAVKEASAVLQELGLLKG